MGGEEDGVVVLRLEEKPDEAGETREGMSSVDERGVERGVMRGVEGLELPSSAFVQRRDERDEWAAQKTKPQRLPRESRSARRAVRGCG